MHLSWLPVVATLLLSLGEAGKGRKNRHHKPGRALFDRLASTLVSESRALGDGYAGDSALLPAPVDAAPYSTITANATCGELGPEDYCREMPGKRGVHCGVCEGAGGTAAWRHPPAHALDGDHSTWWQSPTLATSEDYEQVALVITLPDEMEILHIIIKSGPSPRPLAWSLEASGSRDGDDWRLLRAFGDKEHCWRLWGLRPERHRRKARLVRSHARRSEKITCSTQFSSPRPLENGEMHVALGEGVAARRVRVSLRAQHAAAPDRRFYTARALTVAARCLCHGHAHACTVTDQGTICECSHNTCGVHCSRCCAGGAWRAGAPCGAAGGGQCGCGERGACGSDDSGALVCINCTENRAGPLCDRCLLGYFSVEQDGPCFPCNCDPVGSDGTCVWNKEREERVCACLEGFAGPDCAAPAPDPAPATVPACRCDPRGIVDGSDVCAETCQCKAHVTGERCDACAAGYFGLSAALAGGCRACYCSGAAALCADDPEPSHSMSLPLGEGAWLVSDAMFNVTQPASVDEDGKPYLISYEVEGWEDFFWVPKVFTGVHLASYGSVLRFESFWRVVRGDTGGVPTRGPDVILLGQDGTRLAYGDNAHETPGHTELTVPLLEGGWYEGGAGAGGGGAPAGRARLMGALADVRALLLRARFHLDQDEVRLESAALAGGEARVRERCACAAGFEGAWCERCAWTHVRARGLCVPCACNGHASCDAEGGACGPCAHNTTGAQCSRCAAGHYGNPARGPCRACACPLAAAANNFSPNCALAAAAGDAYVCTQCPAGYVGDHCEACDFGYWGSPTTPGSACRRCACGGAPCDGRSGACIQCPPHTEGARCDQCEEEYWFGPEGAGAGAGEGGGCVPCACGAGALSAACDARGGQCACAAGWAGRACDACAPGHGGVALGCPACRCGAGAGAARGACDAASGACACAEGAAPPACDACLPGHYALSADGCTRCNCSTLGSDSNVCDIRTGQCRCKPHVTGRTCDICEEGYWGLSVGGCRRCACGAGAAACDPVSGACACAPGVGGAQCDACLAGFYGFGSNGCLPCPPCADGKVCSASSGRCVCPARTRGPGCAQCAPGSWARRADGCRPCACAAAALNGVCDPETGQCACRAGWAGRACGACAAGHYGPRCRPCACDAAGARGCDAAGLCPCDGEGRCECKENVVGDKCSRCREGTFGLSREEPRGCTECFCFGRSARCSQAGLTRAAIRRAAPRALALELAPPADAPTAAPPTAVAADDDDAFLDALLTVRADAPESTVSVPWPPTPVYVELEPRFLGDRVTSYGGALRFKVAEEGGRELPPELVAKYPLVRMYAGQDLVLDYYERVPAVNGSHAVRLHESFWRVRAGAGRGGGGGGGGERGRASRAALMVALSDVTRLLLRPSARVPAAAAPLHLLLNNVSLETTVAGESRAAPALGVELCACPAPYAAASCQEPAAGFWTPRRRLRVHRVAGTIVIDLEADAAPCHCRGRAAACDARTGHCLNCTQGTGGPHCESCAEGYYGAPDAPGGCQSCPCPERTRNFASSCFFNDGRLQCLCKPGYAGAECEACARGHWRDGAECRACACEPRGAAAAACDARGRCRCRQFAAGRRCERCLAPRAFLADDGCQPCDNCSQTLLDSIERLTEDLHLRAGVDELSRIPRPFAALDRYMDNATAFNATLTRMRTTFESSSRLRDEDVDVLEERVQKMLNTARHLRAQSLREEQRAHSLSLESMSGLEDVLRERAKIGALAGSLDEFARGERHLTAHRALKEARHLLRGIQEVKLVDYIAGVNDVFDTGHAQSTALQERWYRVQQHARAAARARARLGRWAARAEDAARLADGVWDAADARAARAAAAAPRLARLRDTHLRCALLHRDVLTLSANNYTAETTSAYEEARRLTGDVPALAARLATLTEAVEEKEGILHDLTPLYRNKYLAPVELHAQELAEKAKHYKSLFAEARAAAERGVQAARAWEGVARALGAAAARARAALAAARQAHKLAGAAPAAHAQRSLLVRAHDALAGSARLRARGEALLDDSRELRTDLERSRHGVERVEVALRGLGWAERELAARPEADVGERLAEAGDRADRVFGTTRALYDEAGELRRRARYQLRRQLADLQKQGDTALGAAQELVSQALGDAARAREVAQALRGAADARAREHAAADGLLAPRAARLRAAVARARHAADSISVSLSSAGAAGGCARAYPAGAASASVTRVSLAVSFERAVRDGPLLWYGAEGAAAHVALRVLDGRLRCSWDLGDGEALVVHPLALEAAHDDSDHTSYKIEIERIWNTVRLSVEKVGAEAVSASNSTGGELTSPRWAGAAPALWVGGAPGAGGALPACVHALHYDDRRIGLWNFLEQPAEAKCTGCTQRWYGGGSAGGEPSMVWFNGDGYVELQRSGLRPYDKRQFSVSLTFKTRDEDALLFMAVDEANNRSVSLSLRACRVVFAVRYAAAELAIAGAGRHCSGRAVHVQAIRVFAKNQLEKGSLRVNGEETLGSPEPPVQAAAALPDLAAARYWLGGAPPAAAPAPAPAAPALLGCLGALLVDREGYDLLDTPRRHGVEPRCGTRSLRSVVLEGAGWVALDAPRVRRRAALGVTLSARGPRGLVLLRAAAAADADDDRHYLALALRDGELELSADAGKGELRLRTNGTRYDDGRPHAVRILRAHKKMELWVDEERVGWGELAGGALAARARALALGGLPAGAAGLPAGAADAAALGGFTGTISDIIVDGVLLGLEAAARGPGARLGRADARAPPAAPAPAPPDAPARERPDRCSKASSYTLEPGAVKFGDSPHSYATLKISSKSSKNLTLSLQFRTFRPDGLLLLIPGSKQKPKHYLALWLRDGRLQLVVRGRRRRAVALAARAADGAWRAASVRLAGGRAVLAAGGAAAAARAPRRLALAARLLVGGLPADAARAQLPDAVVRAGGLLGCVRRVVVNGRAEDLVRNAASHHRVGQCFPAVEPGAHFSGDAYATWSSAWAGTDADAEVAAEFGLEFRTSEPDGLLIVARDYVLEMRDGGVALWRRAGGAGGGGAGVRVRGAGGRALCDERWHAVRGRASRASLWLAVDAAEERLADAPPPPRAAAAPLYVAGLPEGEEVFDGRENFKGCIKDVSVGGERRDWRQMEALHHVLLDSCPTH